MDVSEKTAAEVRDKGQVVWPYRPLAPEIPPHGIIGAVMPRAFCEAAATNDLWQMQTQCLVRGFAPVVRAHVRFLHVVLRRVAEIQPGGAHYWVDELEVNGKHHYAGKEGSEREITISELPLDGREGCVTVQFRIPEGSDEAPIRDGDGNEVGEIVRCREALEGEVELSAQRLPDDLFRVTLRINNSSPWEGGDRELALRRALVSTHSLLQVAGGEFLSLTDPPLDAREAAASCNNRHTWPVLIGEPARSDTLLASPIILSDYPQVSSDSAGLSLDGYEKLGNLADPYGALPGFQKSPSLSS